MKPSKLVKKAAAAMFLMLMLLHSVGSTIFAAKVHCEGRSNQVCLSDGGGGIDPSQP